ncbi:thymidylate kinase-domain-containing protein, partial [Podospora conica]
GNTTQFDLLVNGFLVKGKTLKLLGFPDRTTPIGQMIDSYLKSHLDMDDHAIHLLFSANRWEAAKTITTLLSAGTTIICDRYYYSGIVYSAAKRNPSLTLAWARAPEVGLPRPDLVLFLDLDEAQARARGGWGGEVYERAETQKRVKELFWGLSLGQIGTVTDADGEVAVGPPTSETVTGLETRFRQEEEDLHVVDAGAGVDEVAAHVWAVVSRRVEEVERGEVGSVVRRVS